MASSSARGSFVLVCESDCRQYIHSEPAAPYTRQMQPVPSARKALAHRLPLPRLAQLGVAGPCTSGARNITLLKVARHKLGKGVPGDIVSNLCQRPRKGFNFRSGLNSSQASRRPTSGRAISVWRQIFSSTSRKWSRSAT